MSIIVCNCQHCNEQQIQTLSCVHYTIFSVVKLDLFIRALLLDRILALEKLRVRLAYILFLFFSVDRLNPPISNACMIIIFQRDKTYYDTCYLFFLKRVIFFENHTLSRKIAFYSLHISTSKRKHFFPNENIGQLGAGEGLGAQESL